MGKIYQVGELVVYGMHGVCRVVSQEERLVDKKRLNYLALEPVGHGDSRFLVPTQNASAMAVFLYSVGAVYPGFPNQYQRRDVPGIDSGKPGPEDLRGDQPGHY